MTTLLQRAIYKVLHNKLSDQEWVNLLLSCIQKQENAKFPTWYQSIFFQLESNQSIFSVYDAYGLICLHFELGSGNIVYAVINLGEKPSSDRHNFEMNEKLQKLWHPFRGQFWGGNQNEDGAIYVDEPIELSVITMAGQELCKTFTGRFPLEVGITSVYKTLAYLNSGNKRLARWPYNSEKIFLIARE